MREGLAALGVGALALACCALSPIAIGAIGGAALVPFVGVGLGVTLALALIGAAVWRGHRRSCAAEPKAERIGGRPEA
jgi:hypothetical protein